MSLSLSSSFFDIFELEPEFGVSLDHLTGRFRDLQKTYHPDRFVNEDAGRRREAVQLAAHINAGYETLKDPMSRAAYLLDLKGLSESDESKTSSDMEFLMQQMEFRERLEEIPGVSDPLVAADGLKAELKEAVTGLELAFADSFQNEQFDKAKETLLKMKFFRRLLEALDDLEAKLEDELF